MTDRRTFIKITSIALVLDYSFLISGCGDKKSSLLKLQSDYLALIYSLHRSKKLSEEENGIQTVIEMLAQNMPTLKLKIATKAHLSYQHAVYLSQPSNIIEECMALANSKSPFLDANDPNKNPKPYKIGLDVITVLSSPFVVSIPAKIAIGFANLASKGIMDANNSASGQQQGWENDEKINACVFYKSSLKAMTDPNFKKKAVRIDPTFEKKEEYIKANAAEIGYPVELFEKLNDYLDDERQRKELREEIFSEIDEIAFLQQETLKKISEAKDQREKEELAKRFVSDINQTASDIQGAGILLNFVFSGIFGNNSLGQNLLKLSQGMSTMYSAIAMFSINAISPIGFGSQMVTGMSIISSLVNSGPSYEQQVLNGLNSIGERLEQISDSLNRIEKNQLTILKNLDDFIKEVTVNLKVIDLKIDQLRSRVFASYQLLLVISREGNRKAFIDSILSVQRILDLDLTKEKNKNEVFSIYQAFYKYGKYTSKEVAFTGNTQSSLNADLLVEEILSTGYLDLFIGLIPRLFYFGEITQQSNLTSVANPYEWSIASNALMEALISTNSIDSNQIPSYIRNLIAEGNRINIFVENYFNQATLRVAIKNFGSLIGTPIEIAYQLDRGSEKNREYTKFTEGSFMDAFRIWLDEFHSLHGFSTYDVFNYRQQTDPVDVYHMGSSPGLSSVEEIYRMYIVSNDPYEKCLAEGLLINSKISTKIFNGQEYTLYRAEYPGGRPLIPEHPGYFDFPQNDLRGYKNLRVMSSTGDITNSISPLPFLAECDKVLRQWYRTSIETKLYDFLSGKIDGQNEVNNFSKKFELASLTCKVICSFCEWKASLSEDLPLQFTIQDGNIYFESLIDELSKTQHINNVKAIVPLKTLFYLLMKAQAELEDNRNAEVMKMDIMTTMINLNEENIAIYKSYLPKIDTFQGLPIITRTINQLQAIDNLLI